LSANKLPGAFPTDGRRPPTTTGYSRTHNEQFAFTASRSDVEPAASDPGGHG
jgi:hypothetical protein